MSKFLIDREEYYKITEENNSLKEKYKNLKLKYEMYTKLQDVKSKENKEDFTNEIKRLNDSIKTLSEENSKLKNNNNSFIKINEKIKKEKEKLEKQNLELADNKTELTNQISSYRTEISNLKQEIEQLTKLQKIQNTKVALCAIAKNENLYIREWVEYYKNLGISKIFLYDNNEIDGEHFEEVINDYITSGFVELIDVRGTEKGCVYDSEGINLQPKCYIDCYKTKTNEFDWICFFDIDEFLSFKNNQTLFGFLNKDIFKNTDTILIPWVQYDDNNLLFYENLPVTKRFTKISNTKKQAVKSIVRCNKKFNDNYSNTNCLIHCFLLSDKKITKASGQKITKYNKDNWYTLTESQIKSSEAILNHYKTKSTEEFIKRHLNRCWGSGKRFTDLGPRTIEDIMSQYFIICENSKEKQDIFKYFNLKQNENKIFVNFTTWNKRDWCCEKMLNYFKNQTLKPDKIICWLSLEEYHGLIPNSIKRCLDNKLISEIKWIDSNIYGHKRWEALKYFNNAYNIFIDDDIYYPNDFIETLILSCKKYDNKVVSCYYGRTIDYNNGKRINLQYENYPSYKNILYSGLCCVPPKLFPLESFNYSNIRNAYCLKCDDSWINAWLIKKDIKIVGCYEWYDNCLNEIEGTKETSIWRMYNSKNTNNTIQKYVNIVNAFKLLNIENKVNKIWPNININKFISM